MWCGAVMVMCGMVVWRAGRSTGCGLSQERTDEGRPLKFSRGWAKDISLPDEAVAWLDSAHRHLHG